MVNLSVVVIMLMGYISFMKKENLKRNENLAFKVGLLDIFKKAADQYNVPLNILLQVAYIESRFRPDILSGVTISSAGAIGVMQIVPKWHPNIRNYWDSSETVPYAAKYLSELYKRYNNDWYKALAAYNWGLGNIDKTVKEYGFNWIAHIPKETQNYLRMAFNYD